MNSALLKYASLLICILMLSACRKKVPDELVKPPTADFSIDHNDAAPGELVSFTYAGIGAESYEWDFGDGYTSTLQNPTHSYKTKGTFTIRLRVKSAGIESEEVTQLLLVGYRYLNYIYITHIPFTDSLGYNWHNNATGPDFYILAQKEGILDTAYYSPSLVKMRSTDLPAHISINNKLLKLTKEKWVFSVMDANYGNSPQHVMKRFYIDVSQIRESPIRLYLKPDFDIELRFVVM